MSQCRDFRSSDWTVRPCSPSDARALVAAQHYAKGGSNTGVYFHGLYRVGLPSLMGVAWWMPPTRVCAESVNLTQWRKVLALTRLVVLAEVPQNGASFLLAASIRAIRKDGRFVSLVTYADESQGHTGAIYRASNWTYIGRTGPYPRWVDSKGMQVSRLSTKSRTKAGMLALGYINAGAFYKHKFVIHLPPCRPRAAAVDHQEKIQWEVSAAPEAPHAPR